MSKCKNRIFSLDEKHSPADRQALVQHVETCADCRAAVEHWREAEEVLKSNSKLTRVGTPADIEVRALYERLETRDKRRSQLSGLTISWKTAAAFAGTFVLGIVLTAVFYQSLESTGGLNQVPHPKPPQMAVLEQPARIIESPEDAPLLASLEEDMVGLLPSSRLLVNKSHSSLKEMEIDRGAVAFKVEKRNLGEQFVVRAGDLTIRVVGTLFSVQKENEFASVVVIEGTVEVRRGDLEKWMLQMDQKLAADAHGQYQVIELNQADRDLVETLLASKSQKLDQPNDENSERESEIPPADLHRQETKSAPRGKDRLVEIKELFRAGEIESAKSGLEKYVEEHPQDHNARMLLADYFQKSRDFEGSLMHYKRIIDSGGSALGNRARFKAAKLLATELSRYAEAEIHYRVFIERSQGRVLESAAMLGLAEVLVAKGETSEAKELLHEIAVNQGGSVAAVKARKILNELQVE